MNHFRNIIHVPESQRTPDWTKGVCNELINGTYNDYYQREKVYRARKMYRTGDYADSNGYDHIYGAVAKQVEDECGRIETVHLVPPAKIRNIPIIKSMIRRLVSEERERLLVVRAWTTDAINSQKKEDRFIQEITLMQEQKLQQRLQALTLQRQLIAMQQQALQHAAQTSEAKGWVMELQGELNRLQGVIDRGVALGTEELEKVGRFYRYSYKDIQEIMAEKAVNFQITDQRLKHLFNRNFEEKLVTGKESLFVDWEPGMQDPIYEQVFFEQLFFPYNESVLYQHEHSWGIRRVNKSMDNIIAEWGHRIDRKTLYKLQYESGQYQGQQSNAFMTPTGLLLPDYHQIYDHPNGTNEDQFTVHYCYFKAHVKIPILLSPNKHRADAPDFIKVIDEEKADYYKNKPEKLKKTGKKLEYRYRQDLYRGIRIGADTFLTADKHPVQLRSETKRSLVPLPFIGHAESYFYDLESIIWETKDIQELYNIIYYQKELLILLAGVKGVIVDISQKPEGMELDEVIYYMKQGVLPIETVGENGRVKNGAFNQFANYDQTIAPAIQLLDQTLNMLKQLAGEIAGVPDARQGIVRPTDQVGTYQLSSQESSLVTEKFFQDHEELINLALTRGANLSRYAYKEGRRGQYVAGDLITERFNIPKNAMDGEFQLVMESGRKSARMMQEMQNMVRDQYAKGQIAGSTMIGMLDVKSIVEMKKLIKDYEEHAMARAGKQAQQEQERQVAMMEKQAELDARLQDLVDKGKMNLQQMQAQIDQQRIRIDAEKAKADQALKAKEMETKAATEKYKVDNETAIEGAYLQLKKAEVAINDENSKTQLLMGMIQKKMELSSRSKENIKD